METCTCINCYNKVVAKGLCETHYRRLRKHGSTDQTRSVDLGQREKHPLYNSWGWIRKMRGRHQIEPAWENFWQFVKDVGERPTPQHSLRKKEESLGYTKDNLFWKEQLATSEDRAAYARAWRKANPDKAKTSDLKKMYGITLEEYNKMRVDQNCSCDICGKHEDDESQSLAVDNCHDTGKVRGLLCHACNKALGGFKDSFNILRSAMTYLERNQNDSQTN